MFNYFYSNLSGLNQVDRFDCINSKSSENEIKANEF